jgi:hypothetical protein
MRHQQRDGHLTHVGWRMQPTRLPSLRSEAIQFFSWNWIASLRNDGNSYSPPDSNAALPPAAAVLMVTVCSVAKRAR